MLAKEASDPLFDFCLSLPGVTEDVKWGDNLVFSVGGKMFAVFDLPEGEPMSLKVAPDVFPALTLHPGVEPAPYLAKHSWISLARRDVLPIDTLKDLLEDAHALVAAKLSKKRRAELGIES